MQVFGLGDLCPEWYPESPDVWDGMGYIMGKSGSKSRNIYLSIVLFSSTSIVWNQQQNKYNYFHFLQLHLLMMYSWCNKTSKDDMICDVFYLLVERISNVNSLVFERLDIV